MGNSVFMNIIQIRWLFFLLLSGSLLTIGTPDTFAQSSELFNEGSDILTIKNDHQLNQIDQKITILSTVETIDIEGENTGESYRYTISSVKKRWYGHKILYAELGNFIFPGIVYLIGGPIVHVLEEEYMTGLQSLLLRLFAPIAGAGALYSICYSCENDGGARLASVFGGILLGGITAIVIDTTVFAYKEFSVTGAPLAITSQSNSVRWSVDLEALPQPWVLKWVIKF